MPPTDALVLFEEPDGLRQPILIVAFSGWNDAAESATTAARYLGQLWPSRPLASIDPEEFYHFGLSRPYVRFKSESSQEREIVWPSTDFSLATPSGLDRDLIVGVAIEPHLRWRTYCGAVLDLARRVGASLVLTLGALLAEVAHTRPVKLVGGAYDPELAARLGLRASRYEGPTGIVGVLNTMCREEGIPQASLWANVPHYVSGVENPKAAMALVRRVLVLLGAEADLSDLVEASRQFDENLNEVVGQNAKIAEYVRKLERKPPDEDEAGESGPPADQLPPSGDLVAEIEQFLRQQRRDPS
jgi:PAC2 family protein